MKWVRLFNEQQGFSVEFWLSRKKSEGHRRGKINFLSAPRIDNDVACEKSLHVTTLQ